MNDVGFIFKVTYPYLGPKYFNISHYANCFTHIHVREQQCLLSMSLPPRYRADMEMGYSRY